MKNKTKSFDPIIEWENLWGEVLPVVAKNRVILWVVRKDCQDVYRASYRTASRITIIT